MKKLEPPIAQVSPTVVRTTPDSKVQDKSILKQTEKSKVEENSKNWFNMPKRVQNAEKSLTAIEKQNSYFLNSLSERK